MESAMMKPIMKNAILMGVTVVGFVLIWNNALIVGVWLDPLQIIYVSYLIRRAYTFFSKLSLNSANLYRNLYQKFDP
jgi:hypothetical protein